jgi:hypothetical protein
VALGGGQGAAMNPVTEATGGGHRELALAAAPCDVELRSAAAAPRDGSGHLGTGEHTEEEVRATMKINMKKSIQNRGGYRVSHVSAP